MNRSYTAQSPYSLTPTERISTYDDSVADSLDYDADYDADYATDLDADYDEYTDEYAALTDYDEARIDRRWMWIAGVAGAILFIAVVTTSVILGGGDSGSVSVTSTSGAPTSTAAPATTAAPPAAVTPAPAVPSLPPETMTTVSPTAEAPPAAAPAPTEVAPPPVAAAPGTITYRVTGTRPLLDLVTVIYTDQQGALQTDVNVALPWTKTVVLDPGVSLGSVTATSVTGQLNCSIADASGALIAAQNNNSMIATCTK